MIAVRGEVAVALLAAACGGGGEKVYVRSAYKPKRVVLGAGTPDQRRPLAELRRHDRSPSATSAPVRAGARTG
jgi:hypothetical protein